MDEYKINDAGDIRKYYIQVPNLIDDIGLSLIAFRLYIHLKRVAGENGVCYQSGDTISKACNMSVGAVSKAKQELIKLGLVIVTPKKDKVKVYHEITISDVWQRNIKSYSPSPGELSLSLNELSLSPSERLSSPGETKNNPIKNKPIKKEPIKNAEQKNMFSTLAILCKLDPELKGGYIGKTAAALVKAKYTLGDVEIFREWWQTRDFRGIKGDAPTLANVMDGILKAKQESKPKVDMPGHMGKVNGVEMFIPDKEPF